MRNVTLPTCFRPCAGHFIDSLDGRDLGWVISDAKKFWKLNDGKVIQRRGAK